MPLLCAAWESSLQEERTVSRTAGVASNLADMLDPPAQEVRDRSKSKISLTLCFKDTILLPRISQIDKPQQ